jgi:hypothetical protein
MEKRFGKIRVSKGFMEQDVETVADIFSKVKAVVLWCEHDYANGVFNYQIYSPLFDVVREGYMVPEYEFMVTVEWDNDGTRKDFEIVPRLCPSGFNTPFNPSTAEVSLWKRG